MTEGNVAKVVTSSQSRNNRIKHYTRSLEISESLLKANPDAAAAARDVIVSHAKLAGFFASARENQAANNEAAARHYRACYDLLHPRITKGMVFD